MTDGLSGLNSGAHDPVRTSRHASSCVIRSIQAKAPFPGGVGAEQPTNAESLPLHRAARVAFRAAGLFMKKQADQSAPPAEVDRPINGGKGVFAPW
jgi:hypothetical protein